MPVAVGISEAVIAMRSTVSLAAGAAKASEALRAKAKAGRNDMRALLSATDAMAETQQEAGQGIYRWDFRSEAQALTKLQAGCIKIAPSRRFSKVSRGLSCAFSPRRSPQKPIRSRRSRPAGRATSRRCISAR